MYLRAAIPVCIVVLSSVAAPVQARHGDTVECRSSGYKYTECEAAFRHPQLVKQLSETECVADKSWGYNRKTSSIWVSQGCAAVFADGDDHDSQHERDDRSSESHDRGDERRDYQRRQETVECRSKNYAFTRCQANWEKARLVEKLSEKRCVEGESWGVDEHGLWVDKGCGGRFSGH